MVRPVNQCHLAKLQMEVAILWQFVFLTEQEEWFNASAELDLQVCRVEMILKPLKKVQDIPFFDQSDESIHKM